MRWNSGDNRISYQRNPVWRSFDNHKPQWWFSLGFTPPTPNHPHTIITSQRKKKQKRFKSNLRIPLESARDSCRLLWPPVKNLLIKRQVHVFQPNPLFSKSLMRSQCSLCVCVRWCTRPYTQRRFQTTTKAHKNPNGSKERKKNATEGSLWALNVCALFENENRLTKFSWKKWRKRHSAQRTQQAHRKPYELVVSYWMPLWFSFVDLREKKWRWSEREAANGKKCIARFSAMLNIRTDAFIH